MKSIFTTCTLLVLFLVSACGENMSEADRQQEEERLMAASRAWADSKSPEEFLSYWADDAVFIGPGQPTLRGKEEIAAMLQTAMSIPGFKVDWEPQEAHVSESGDMGYLIENLSQTVNDSLGNPITAYFKAVTIWEKQEDGSWKNVVDTYNLDPSITEL